MCGIFTAYGANYHWISLESSFNKISYRGPDSSSVVNVNKKLIMAFHRLAIMGLNNSGNQPMKHPNDESLTLMCNGEIYNYKELAHKYNYSLSTGSDCEIILHLYEFMDIDTLCNSLDGVFGFILYDNSQKKIIVGHDPYGIRSLYFYHDKSPINTLDKVVSDFQKAIVKEIKTIQATTLDITLQNLKFNNKIDYMNLDVEGHEMNVLKAFDLSLYKPSIISVEFLDLDMKYLEFKNNNNLIDYEL